jgi:hypothetical protein
MIRAKLLADGFNQFVRGRPVRVAGIAVENERSGFEVVFEFFFVKGHALVVVIGANDVDMDGAHVLGLGRLGLKRRARLRMSGFSPREQDYSAYGKYCTRDRPERNVMGFIARGVNWAYIEHSFASSKPKSPPNHDGDACEDK